MFDSLGQTFSVEAQQVFRSIVGLNSLQRKGEIFLDPQQKISGCLRRASGIGPGEAQPGITVDGRELVIPVAHDNQMLGVNLNQISWSHIPHLFTGLDSGNALVQPLTPFQAPGNIGLSNQPLLKRIRLTDDADSLMP